MNELKMTKELFDLLNPILNKRISIQSTVKEFEYLSGIYREHLEHRYLILTNLKIFNTNKKIADEYWFKFIRGFANKDIERRDKVVFDAKLIVKKDSNRKYYLFLERPTKIRIIK